jgi:predicted ATP-grasp superfamily ATP-dependent carboligase
VFKPRHGAGSQATFLVRNELELSRCSAQARDESFTGEAILQPFVPGQPASVAFLLGAGRCIPLWPAAQHLSDDGRFRYLGGAAPLPESLRRRAGSIAERAVACVPGLRGYVGVDLVLGDVADGSADMVIEINPRLTTSYIGLRQLTKANLAEWMLALADARACSAPPLSPADGGEGSGVRGIGDVLCRERQVRFFPDGHWHFL